MPAASGAPGASGAPAGGGETIQITAQGVAYQPTTLTTKADAAFHIDFKNQDPGTPHNVTIHKDSPTGQELFKGEVFSGIGEKTYDVPALPAGTYAYVCTVHPSMIGTLTVQ